MTGHNKAIQKYLQHYAEPTPGWGNGNEMDKGTVYHQAVVIPAFNESAAFIQRLQLLAGSRRTLFVIVLNGPESMSRDEICTTMQPLRYMQAATASTGMNSNNDSDSTPLHYLFQQPDHDFLFIDLVHNPIAQPSHRGVGYARKFGMDCCLRLYQQKQLVSPLVRNTDADVYWPANYLQPFANDPTISVLLFPFHHTAVEAEDEKECEAAALYDSWLRYYVAGLQWANSPWAFHSVGSTLVVHLHHYAIQRGFPKKQAGEDFYLLNKLAKSGRIVQLPGPELALSNRSSNRTPFGTGRSINSIKLNTAGAWKFYHPEIFAQLRYWYEQLPSLYFTLSEQPVATITLPAFPQAFHPMYEALSALNINKLLQHSMKHSCDQDGFRRHLRQGLDAASTRKLVHWMRDRYYPGIEFQGLCVALNNGTIPFLAPASAPVKTASELARHLRLATTQRQTACGAGPG